MSQLSSISCPLTLSPLIARTDGGTGAGCLFATRSIFIIIVYNHNAMKAPVCLSTDNPARVPVL